MKRVIGFLSVIFITILFSINSFSNHDFDTISDVTFEGTNIGGILRFGDEVSDAGDVNGDGYDDILAVDILGRVYVFFGGLVMDSIADIVLQINGTVKSCSSAGDVNNDGYDDVIVGDYNDDPNLARSYIYYGAIDMDSIADIKLKGGVDDKWFGYNVSTVGDVNGDNFSDVIVSACDINSNIRNCYIFFGASDMDSIADLQLVGEAANDEFGVNTSTAGDVNNDGYDDIIISDRRYNSYTGRCYLYFGGASMDSIADITMTGADTWTYLGTSVSKAGDVNNDNYDDVIIGSPRNSGLDESYIFFGGSSMDNTADIIFTGGSENEYFGGRVANIGDVNGDNYDDVLISDYAYNNYQGIGYIYFGGSSMNSNADVILEGSEEGSYFGESISFAGDVNGDNFDDVIIGESYYYSRTGRICIYQGGLSMDSIPDMSAIGEDYGGNFGSSVANAGDVNGDGYEDVIIGSQGYNRSRGRAYIYFGGILEDTIPDIILEGEIKDSYFGYVVSSLGDINKDGFDDVVIGAYGYNNYRGRCYIYYGGSSMDSIADFVMTGEEEGDRFGYSLSSLDFNRDSYNDLIIGADRNNEKRGRCYIYYGGAEMDTIADLTISGQEADNRFGKSVSDAGDVNGDGYNDIIIGAWRYSNSTGRGYIFFGGDSPDTIADVIFSGENDWDWFGSMVSNVGDINGDGFEDVVIVAPRYDSDKGKCYLYYGGSEMDTIADFVITGEEENSYYVEKIMNIKDINGDGYNDLAISKNSILNIYYGNSDFDTIPDVQMHFSLMSYASAGDFNADGGNDLIIGRYESGFGNANIYYGEILPLPEILIQPVSRMSCEFIPDTFFIAVNLARKYQWQVSTDGGNSFSDIIDDDSVYFGSHTQNLIILPDSVMDQYKFRCIASNFSGDTISDTVTYTTHPIFRDIEYASICEGNEYTWRGADYTNTGAYSELYNSIYSCDSIYELNLTVNPVYYFETLDTICEGEMYNWYGKDVDSTDTYYTNYTTVSGCDSVYQLSLFVNPVPLAGFSYMIDLNEVTFSNQSTNANYCSWDFGDGANSVSINPVHVYESFGSFNVILYANNNYCADTTEYYIVITETDISDQINEFTELYPNPTRDLITITSQDKNYIERIELVSVCGNIMDISIQDNTINLKNLENGLYFVKIYTSDNRIITRKIIKY